MKQTVQIAPGELNAATQSLARCGEERLSCLGNAPGGGRSVNLIYRSELVDGEAVDEVLLQHETRCAVELAERFSECGLHQFPARFLQNGELRIIIDRGNLHRRFVVVGELAPGCLARGRERRSNRDGSQPPRELAAPLVGRDRTCAVATSNEKFLQNVLNDIFRSIVVLGHGDRSSTSRCYAFDPEILEGRTASARAAPGHVEVRGAKVLELEQALRTTEKTKGEFFRRAVKTRMGHDGPIGNLESASSKFVGQGSPSYQANERMIDWPPMASPSRVSTGECLDDETMAGFLEATLSDAEREAATLHLSTCHACREQFTELARLESDEPDSYRSLAFDEEGEALHPTVGDVAELDVGTSLGRYILLGKVGEGGMGVVYSAFDPELDRRIAVKVIRSEMASAGDDARRMLREEARAMARLTHPNVVRVYDVGSQGSLVYIAMEYVDGVDLGRFSARHSEDWRTVFDACIQAGRGLIAAHDAGLVHRDFKPSNVLCAKDGRVLVADFGLTRFLLPDVGSGDTSKTRVSGTPGYLAPEQASGEHSTAKSDQYSYCVTLAQCLLGRKPLPDADPYADTATSSSMSGTDVTNDFVVDDPIAPKRFRSILKRGMATRPEDRHASMQELLDQLEGLVRRGRRVKFVLGAAAMAIGMAGLMFALGQRSGKQDVVCTNSTEPMDAIWNDGRRTALAGFLSESPYRDHGMHFLASVESVASGLSEEHVVSCEATFKTHSQSTDLYDRRMLCLRSQVTELGTVLDMVEKGGSVELAQSALAKMGVPADCEPSEIMLSAEAPPTSLEDRERMREIDKALIDSNLLARNDKSDERLATVERALQLATELDYGPYTSRVQLLYSNALDGAERFDESLAAAEKSRDAAAKSRANVLLVRSLMQLADLVVTQKDDASKAAAYIDTARSLSLGVELPAYYLASLHRTAAIVARFEEKREEAIDEAREGLRVLAAAGSESQLARGMELRESLLSVIASTQFDMDEYDEALKGFEQVAELKSNRLGPKHSAIASSLANLATMQYKLGRMDEAHDALRKARELLTSPDASKSVLSRCLNLEGLILNRLGRPEESVVVYREAIAVQTEVYGEDHRMVWATKNNLANVLVELEEWKEAIEMQEEQIRWSTERGGKDSQKTITARINLANTLAQGGTSEEEFERVYAVVEELLDTLPADDRRRINVLAVRGQALFRQERNREAAMAFTRAIALADKTDNVRETFTAFLLTRQAEAKWRSGEKRGGLDAARRAQGIYETLPEKEDLRKELEAWIAEHESKL